MHKQNIVRHTKTEKLSLLVAKSGVEDKKRMLFPVPDQKVREGHVTLFKVNIVFSVCGGHGER